MSADNADQTPIRDINAANVNLGGTQNFYRDAYFTYIKTTEPLAGRVFITYAQRHGSEFALWLQRELVMVRYGVSLQGEVEDWQAALSRSDYVVALLTSDAARDDSPVTAQVRYAASQGKPIVVVRRQPGFTPVPLFNTPYINAQMDQGTALAALLQVLRGQTPQTAVWVTHGEPHITLPDIFIGRQEMLETFERVLSTAGREGRSSHILYGAARTGKSTLLHTLKQMAEAAGAITLYADLDPLGQPDEERLTIDEAISSFWAQLLRQYPPALRGFNDIDSDHAFISAGVQLRLMLIEAAGQHPLIILIDNLHMDNSGVLIGLLNKLTAPLVLIATALQDAFTPEIKLTGRVRTHKLPMLQPRDIGLMFAPPDFEIGHDIFDLTEGVPEIVRDMLAYWISGGHLRWAEGQLYRETAQALPDLWAERLDARLEEALAALPILAELESDDLLDWMTCAAVQGVVFSETVLLAAVEDEISHEQSAALLTFLAAAAHPVIVPAPSPYPFETRCWRFVPAGLPELHLRDADAVDVAHYGEASLLALERAAHPTPWRVRHPLYALAKQTLDYLLRHLQGQELSSVEIETALRASAAYPRLIQYGAALDRETRILGLRLLYNLAETPREAWDALRQLARAMIDYDHNDETARTARLARHTGYEARAARHDLAGMFYLEASVSVNTPHKALRLLRAGWRTLPAPLRDLPMLTPVLQIRADPTHPLHMELNQTLTRENMSIMERLLDLNGQMWSNLGEPRRALEYYAQALPLIRAVGDKRSEAATLNNIGEVYHNLGEPRRALEYLEQALPLQQAVGDRRGEAVTLHNIGSVYRKLGEPRRALEYYAQALPLRQAVGDRGGEALTLNNIGSVYLELGEPRRDLEYLEQALLLYRAVGDKRGEAATLNNIGAVYRALGELRRALGYYAQALPLRQAVGDKRGEAVTLHNIGGVYDDLGELEKAIAHLEQAVPLAEQVEHPRAAQFRSDLEFLTLKRQAMHNQNPSSEEENHEQ
ncbi:MAG: hypothetical protein OHK0046_36980 [Anaerolineae bacterium]